MAKNGHFWAFLGHFSGIFVEKIDKISKSGSCPVDFRELATSRNTYSMPIRSDVCAVWCRFKIIIWIFCSITRGDPLSFFGFSSISNHKISPKSSKSRSQTRNCEISLNKTYTWSGLISAVIYQHKNASNMWFWPSKTSKRCLFPLSGVSDHCG